MSLGTAVRQLQQQYSTAQIREMIRLYTAAYGNSGMNARQVLEEMVCDAMGKMNAFATEETSTVAGEVGQFLRDLRKEALETQTDGQKNNAPEGVKFSRELTTDGRVVAVVDEDILSNLDLSNWNQETKEAAQKAAAAALLKFQDGIAVEGITRKVNRISRKEFTRSEYTNELFWWNSTAFLDKMRAANNLDDVVIATTDWARDGKLKHPRTDNFVDFDHGTTLIASGDAKYEAEVVVGITDKGDAVFYDIVNMKQGDFSIKKKESSPTATTNKSPGSIFEDSSKKNVAQQSENVKQKYSRELDSEYMELAKDPEGNRRELQEMVDQAAEAAGYEYKRNTRRKHSPANDVPWQMFVRGVDKYQGNYGDYTYYATDKGATSIDEIMPKLRELAEEFYGETVSDEEINPPDIVMSAGVWDDMDFVQYAWDNYFEGEMDRTGKVPAVVTEDGMIVIDEDFSRVKSGDTVEYDDNGKVIPLSERFNSDKRDIRYSRELDSEYMELAKDPEGNSTELRKMVDQAAEQQGYKTLFYHGSKKGGGFTEFRDWQYFTPKKEYAERYAQRGNPDSLYSVFVKMENPFDTRNAKARRIFQKARGELGLSEIQGTGLPDWTDGYDLADYIDENGLNYDAIVLDEGGDLVNGRPVSRGLSYVVRKSNQVKSADAVVYDDNGKVIPLSERFNSDKRDIRYSRELTTDGRIVAVVDEDILSNLDLSNWNQETKKAAQKAATEALLKFQDGIVVEGITREVTRRSRREFTRSEYTTQLFRERNTAFLDKMRAANNLDDVVIAATDWARDGKLKHPRADNFVDFDHGTTLIASGDAKYEAEVVVGITDKGTAVFYDIVNMQPGNFSIKNEEPSTTATTNKSPGDIHEGSSKARVAQQEQNVKQKFSRELETVEELQRQNELLQEQRDYWRGQTEVTGRAATKWQIRALANQLMRRYHSQTEVDEIVPELEWLVKNVTKADWDISYADITNAAEAVAASVIGGSGANYNADQWGTGQEIKDFLRQNAIKADNTADSPLLYSVRMLTWAEVSWSMLPSS